MHPPWPRAADIVCPRPRRSAEDSFAVDQGVNDGRLENALGGQRPVEDHEVSGFTYLDRPAHAVEPRPFVYAEPAVYASIAVRRSRDCIGSRGSLSAPAPTACGSAGGAVR